MAVEEYVPPAYVPPAPVVKKQHSKWFYLIIGGVIMFVALGVIGVATGAGETESTYTPPATVNAPPVSNDAVLTAFIDSHPEYVDAACAAIDEIGYATAEQSFAQGYNQTAPVAGAPSAAEAFAALAARC